MSTFVAQIYNYCTRSHSRLFQNKFWRSILLLSNLCKQQQLFWHGFEGKPWMDHGAMEM